VQRLEALEDKIACDVDHWLDRIIGGFVTNFVVNTSVSYSEAERSFLKGLAGIVGINRQHNHLKGVETWFQHPPILLGVRL